MPGLFGLWHGQKQPIEERELREMSESMRHQPGLKIEFDFWPGMGAGRVHLGLLQPQPQPATEPSGRYFLWLDGEFRNRSEMATAFGIDLSTALSDSELALALYKRSGWSFVRKANGLFNICLYDKTSHELTLANDRYGLRPLYWFSTSDGFAFAGEVKAISCLPGFALRIDPQATQEWFSFGYLLGNRTWFSGVEMLPPATILTVRRDGIEHDQYWSWGDITELQGHTPETDIVREAGRLWIQAVERCVDSRKLGVSLSGGLDSRAVLAAIPESRRDLHAMTFGIKDCDDCTIAQQVAALRGIDHTVYTLEDENWFQPRLDGIWRTDGMLNLLHMHGLEFASSYAQAVEVDLQSFAGDLILGGSYLNPKYVTQWPRSFDHVFNRMNQHSSIIPKSTAIELLRPHYLKHAEARHSDYFFLDHHVRRFTAEGTIAISAYIERRFPTYDIDLIEFIYSIDSKLRLHGNIYRKMLLHCFPYYYKTIPWQKTGYTIKRGLYATIITDWFSQLMDLVYSRTGAFNTRRGTKRGYADYSNWLRSILRKKSMYKSILHHYSNFSLPSTSSIKTTIDQFMRGRSNGTNSIGLILTFMFFRERISR